MAINKEYVPIDNQPTIKPRTVTGIFTRYIAKTIPLAFDESMSYYECLCALLEYINTKVIPALDNNAAGLLELQEFYEELQTYVNDYFKNLDVQEEINNKLDEMVESGVLEQIIEQFLQSTAIWGFDTVEDMSNATNLINGSFARTLGYNTINDGGGGLYKITDTEDSNFEQIKLNNGLYANYINESLVVSIENYDGETAEERLFKALDDVTFGTIICGYVEINHVYTAKAKDYRNISIVGATLDIKIDYWFNQAESNYKSVPVFKDCSIKGNGHVFYDNSYIITGPTFNNCDLNNVIIYNGNNYVQSLYIIGSTLNNIGNLVTCSQYYDLKFTNNRVESGNGKLFVGTHDITILQGVISDCLIEGRTEVILEFKSFYKLVIRDNYFEANLKGLFNQIGAGKACYITVDNNAFFGNLNVDYVMTFESTTAINQAKITNNLCNYDTGKLLSNIDINYDPVRNIGQSNNNYAHAFNNEGFPLTGNRYKEVNYNQSNGTWDSTDNTWNYNYIMPYGVANENLHPLYVIFHGNFGNTTLYSGYAILRLTPRVAYSSENNQHIVCDCTIIDSCNKNNVNKTSDVTASVSLSSISPGTSNLTISVKIGGFTNIRGKFRIIDPFTVMQIISKY